MFNFYDSRGKQVGSVTQQGGTTNYTDGQGENIGFSNQNGTFDKDADRSGDQGMGQFLFGQDKN